MSAEAALPSEPGPQRVPAHSPDGRFAGQAAVVTGGASGIGKRIVERLTDEGARVVVGDIDEAALGRMSEALGDRVSTHRTDVSSETDIAALVDAAVERFGGLDVAINCAGAVVDGVIVELDADDWDRVFTVTCRGVFLSIKHEARQMIAQGRGGAIVTITSINSVTPVHGAVAYNAAKAGAAMIVQNAALELGEHGIRSNGVAPSLVATPLTDFMRSVPGVVDAFMQFSPLGRVGTTDDVAAAALFLASDEASWISGVNLLVDGGHRTVGYPNLTALFAGIAPPSVGRAEKSNNEDHHD
jgi:meso-butanediol dehydrogenase/(S,S)-butanediol dehydrogenase/diacetyl reductase